MEKNTNKIKISAIDIAKRNLIKLMSIIRYTTRIMLAALSPLINTVNTNTIKRIEHGNIFFHTK